MEIVFPSINVGSKIHIKIPLFSSDFHWVGALPMTARCSSLNLRSLNASIPTMVKPRNPAVILTTCPLLNVTKSFLLYFGLIHRLLSHSLV